MATYVEQGFASPDAGMTALSHSGVVVYSLTSAADGTELTGTGDVLIINSDAAGWFHVSITDGTDKAASTKTHRVLANLPREIGGVMKGRFISFLADV